MGTAKRERQKANRALKLEQQAKQERVQKVKRTGTRWLLTALALILVVLAVLWAAGVFKGDKSDSSADATGTAAATSTPNSTVPATTPVTYPPMSTPTVSVPATAPTELKVTELVPGEGPKAAAGDTVRVYYVGVNSDGVEFDNSYETGTAFPVLIGNGQVIQGWDEGLVGVQKGGRYQIDIPSDKAYGSEGFGANIKPDQALTFVIDVLAVEPAGQ